MAPTRKPIYSKYSKGYEPRLLRYVDTSPPRKFSAYVEAGMKALLSNVGAAAAFQRAYPSEQAYNEAHNITPLEEIAVINHFLQDVIPTEETPEVEEVFLPIPPRLVIDLSGPEIIDLTEN